MRTIKNKLLIFKQQIFYYKFNLLYPSIPWFGSRACKKKNFLTPMVKGSKKSSKKNIMNFYINKGVALYKY